MKNNVNIILALVVAGLFSACGSGASESANTDARMPKEVSGNAEKGKQIFTDKGCTACHQADAKVVGPSMKDISAAYAGKSGQMVSFLKEEADAIVDPSQFAIMQANLVNTKNMSDEELADLVSYMMSVK